VTEVNGRKIGSGKPGGVTARVNEAFRKYVMDPANGDRCT
jgi:hypothetical protein